MSAYININQVEASNAHCRVKRPRHTPALSTPAAAAAAAVGAAVAVASSTSTGSSLLRSRWRARVWVSLCVLNERIMGGGEESATLFADYTALTRGRPAAA